MKTRIIQYLEANPNQWDEFVYKNSMGYAYFLYHVIAEDRYVNDKNISFCIFDDDKNEIVMIAQLHIEHRDTDQRYRLHSRWGFVYKDGLPKKEFNKLRNAYVEYIDGLYVKYNIFSFEIGLPALSEYSQPQKGLVISPLIHFCFIPSLRYTYIVNLKLSRDELLQNCDQTTRQAIKKIRTEEKYDIYEPDITDDNYKIYSNLSIETYTRTGGTLINDKYNQNIFYNIFKNGNCKVYFLREKETGNIIADVTILLYKNTAYYWWGCSKDIKEVGVNKYLLFEAMLKIKDDYSTEDEDFWFEIGGHMFMQEMVKIKG